MNKHCPICRMSSPDHKLDCQNAYYVETLTTELADLRDAAREYLHTGHTPRCWAQWNGRSNPITHPACICGHDKLKALLQEKGE